MCHRECVGGRWCLGCPGVYAGPGSIWERGVLGESDGQGVFCGDFRGGFLEVVGWCGHQGEFGDARVRRRGEEGGLRWCSVQREGGSDPDVVCVLGVGKIIFRRTLMSWGDSDGQTLIHQFIFQTQS